MQVIVRYTLLCLIDATCGISLDIVLMTFSTGSLRVNSSKCRKDQSLSLLAHWGSLKEFRTFSLHFHLHCMVTPGVAIHLVTIDQFWGWLGLVLYIPMCLVSKDLYKIEITFLLLLLWLDYKKQIYIHGYWTNKIQLSW